MDNIELFSTEQLVDELLKRHSAGAFVGLKIQQGKSEDGKRNMDSLTMGTSGYPYIVFGLLQTIMETSFHNHQAQSTFSKSSYYETLVDNYYKAETKNEK